MRIIWDENKNLENIKKHHVFFEVKYYGGK